ncbi:adhesion G-protein coupled receptor G1 isoform X1 [Alosa sapidissima]|uniref:adhesion G-protein coupled receptor G1 isoform X1 n=3 Tax=Alosa sapidissima TaxID=34773 RepID=UPI001C07F818|nr:adhesion G-protein coupled receptor G1 isoform X1 [Alosa sapidissima]
MVPVVLLLLLIGAEPESGALSEPFCKDGDSFQAPVNISYNNETDGFSVYISTCELEVTNNLQNFTCRWMGRPCYAQCSGGNASLVNLTDPNYVCLHDKCAGFYLHGSNLSCVTTICTEENIIALLHENYNQNATVEDLKRTLNVKRICSNNFDEMKLVDFYTGVENHIIHNVIRDTSITTSPVEHDLVDIVMTITRVNGSTQDNFINATSQMVVPGHNPVETLIPLEAFQNTSEDRQKAAVVHYVSPQQFTVSQDVDLVSSVVRVELLDKPPTPLKTLLSMTFTVDVCDWVEPNNYSKELNTTYNLSCQYYDELTHQTGLRWSSRGCEMKILNSENHSSLLVQCQCDHMTPFAVLLIPGLEEHLGEHWSILSYLSYIGCGLSAFFCSISIFTYFILRKSWKDTSSEIHISLSGALLLLNFTFLMNQWAAHQNPVAVCVCVAVVIEYALLCSFTWMAIEALHLYLMLIRVFNVYYARYMLKLSLIGWGVPAVVVGLSMVVKLDDGSIAYGLVGTEDSTNKYCWIRSKVFAYTLNLTFFSLVFLMNTGVLVIVSWRILRLQRGGGVAGSRAGAGTGLSCGSVLIVLGLTCLLGSSWGLAFLSYGHTNLVALYLFCILNSLQGLFLFLWVYGTGRKRRREQQGASSSSFSNKTT